MNTEPSRVPSCLYAVSLFLVLSPILSYLSGLSKHWKLLLLLLGGINVLQALEENPWASCSSAELLFQLKKLVPRGASGLLLAMQSFERGRIIHSQSPATKCQSDMVTLKCVVPFCCRKTQTRAGTGGSCG